MTDPASPMEANFARDRQTAQRALAAATDRHQRASRTEARTRAQAVTASARRIDVADRREAERYKRRARAWQGDAWRFHWEVPEIGHGARFFGNALSKLRLYAGVVTEQGAVPIPLDEALEIGVPGLTEIEVAVVNDAVSRIASNEGGQAEIQRDYGINEWVAGDCTLVGLPDDDAETGENWRLLSTSELITVGTDFAIKSAPEQPDGDATKIPGDAPMYRLWTRDPQWSDLADSPVRRVLEICDELVILTRSIKGAATSRIPRGAFVIPESITAGAPDVTQDETGGEAEADPVIASLVQHFVAAITDPASAASMAPYILAVPDEAVGKLQYVDFGSRFDAAEGATRNELIRRLANGVDLPPEIMLGLADVNHWTAWQIDEQTFKSYVEPYALNLVTSLTYAYLRQALRVAGVADPSRFVIWYDPANLIGNADKGPSADFGVQNALISGATWRRVRGYADADAPDADELAERLLIGRGAIDNVVTAQLLQQVLAELALDEGTAPVAIGAAPVAAVEGTPASSPDSVVEAPAEGPPAPLESPAGEVVEVTAAAGDVDLEALAELAERLARADRALRERLMIAADAALRRSLERAGARLRSKALRASGVQADVIDGVPNVDVASTLGAPLVAALDSTVEDLLAESFDEFGERFDQWVERAQRAALLDIADTVGADEFDVEAIRAQQDEDRSAAWLLMLGTLVAEANGRMFDPRPAAPPLGEFDPTITVPPGSVRLAMARAGGAQGIETSGGAILTGVAETPQTGLALGSLLQDALADAGLAPRGYRWLYGDPGSREVNFDPHLDLDGVEFESFTDPVLTNSFSWPETPYFFPGDHRYCQCDFAPAFAATGDDAGNELAAAATLDGTEA